MFLPLGGKKYNIFFYVLINVETLQTLQKGTSSDVLTSSFHSPLQVWFFLYSCYITLIYSCYSAPETDGTALGLQEPFDQLLVGREGKHLHTALWQPVWNASAPSRMVGKCPHQKKKYTITTDTNKSQRNVTWMGKFQFIILYHLQSQHRAKLFLLISSAKPSHNAFYLLWKLLPSFCNK